MQVVFLDNSTEYLLTCKPNELKLILAMVRVCHNNVVDFYRKSLKIKELVGMSDKSIDNGLTALCKKGIIVKTGVPKVWFIDPSYFMKGYYKAVYCIAALIEEKDQHLLEKIDTWKSEAFLYKGSKTLEALWEKKRKVQNEGLIDEIVKGVNYGA